MLFDMLFDMKKKRSLLSVVSLILALIILTSQLTLLASCKKDDEGDIADTTETPDGVPDGEAQALSYVDTQGKPILNANYCKDLQELTEPLPTRLYSNAEGAPTAFVGALWNAEHLVLKLDCSEPDSVSLRINDFAAELTAEELGKTRPAYLKMDFAEMGFLPMDMGQLIAFTMEVKEGGLVSVFDGYIQLADYQVCFNTNGTENEFTSVTSSYSADDSVDFSEEGIHICDRYSEDKEKLSYINTTLTKSAIPDMSAGKSYVFEADVTINAMPIMAPSFFSDSSALGLSFNFCADSKSPSPLFSLINSESGILFVLTGKTSDQLIYANTSKQVGDSFKLGVTLSSDGNITLYVDGIAIETFSGYTAVRGGFGSGSMSVVWQRDKAAPKSSADDMDVTISSLSLYFDQSKSILDNISVNQLFGGKKVQKADGDEIYVAKEDLTLPEEVTSKKYSLSATPTWVSSNTNVITDDGKFTAPAESGEFVTLTLYILDEKTIVSERRFNFFVKGQAPSANVSYVKNDTSPFTTSFKSADTVFTFDKNLNSVIYDMGEVTRINRASITSTEAIGLSDKNLLSVFYSVDGKSFTYIEDFSLFTAEKTLHFYNFDVEARYIKIHSTHNGAHDITGRVINSLQRMMWAGYTEAPLLAEGEFAKSATVSIKNDTSVKIYDEIRRLTLSDMGISASDLKSDMSDIRFMAEGKYLPHYLDADGGFYIRIPELPASSAVDVKVLYGNETAESVSDGNEVFEVQYGTKYAWAYNTPGWKHDVFRMPNGDILKVVQIGDSLAYYRSTNGGLSFADYVLIPETKGVVNSAGGIIVDDENDKVFLFAYEYYTDSKPYWCYYYIFESNDSGKTWSGPITPSGDNIPEYSLSYSDGIKLSCFDGSGPNVDYVFTTGVMKNLNDASFATTAMYSKDGGKTWLFSDSRINYEFGNYLGWEGGCSEEAVYEQSDGTLIVYARCQIAEVCHFAVSRSYDHGVTWTKPEIDDLSNVYTTNTQPIIEPLNGSPVLLWGGNNSLGGKTYMRFPLNMATSSDEGDTFTNIIDASFRTIITNVDRTVGRSLHTNPDLAFYKYCGLDLCYIVSTRHEMYIMNVDDFLTKTKGAFDSFEDGMKADGWLAVKGSPSVTRTGATDGDKAMLLPTNAGVNRSLHYIEEGTISFDINVSSFGSYCAFELQTAYNDTEGITAPIRLYVAEDGSLYTYTSTLMDGNERKSLGLKLSEGDNKVSIDFNGNTGKVTLTVNGESADMTYIDGIDNYVSYITIFTGKNTDMALDRFVAIKNK